MVSTRIDTAKLKLAAEQAAKKIEEANALLAPYLVVLSDQERAKIPRTRDGFDEATRSLSRGIEGHANGVVEDSLNEDVRRRRVVSPAGHAFGHAEGVEQGVGAVLAGVDLPVRRPRIGLVLELQHALPPVRGALHRLVDANRDGAVLVLARVVEDALHEDVGQRRGRCAVRHAAAL